MSEDDRFKAMGQVIQVAAATPGKRRKLMEAWASYCSGQDNVVPMIRAAAARL
jgi:hypothetical protein